MKQQNATKIMIVVLLAIIAILVLAFINANPGGQSEEPQDSPEPTMQDVTDEEVRSDEKTFEFIDPADWEHTERAEAAVQSLAPGQRISFGIVQSPDDEDLVYFATSVYDQPKDEMLLSVYEYNTSNYNWERLFRRTYSEGDFELLDEFIVPVFRVIGFDSENIIILAQHVDDSPGPCSIPLLLGAQSGVMQNDGESVNARVLIAMDTNDPYSGFEEYTPPEGALDDAEQDEAECQEEFEANF